MWNYAAMIIWIGSTLGASTKYGEIPENRIVGSSEIAINVFEISEITCCAICEEYPKCDAVNYRKDNGLCVRLEKPSSDLFNPITNLEWSVFIKNVSDVNIMTGIIATQKSTRFDFTAELAVDGNTFGEINTPPLPTCSHTNWNLNPWWMIDFGKIIPVTDDRLTNISITVARTITTIDSADNVCATYAGPPSSPGNNQIILPCGSDVDGQYVKIIRIITNGPLTLCEVTFF